MVQFIQNVITIGIIKDYIGIESQWKKEKDIESLEVVDNKELAKYIVKEMEGCTVKGIGIDGEWLYVKKPFENELAFWIQQFKTRKYDGHSEWSDRYNRNIWVSDYKEEE